MNEIAKRDPAIQRVGLQEVLAHVDEERKAVDQILMVVESTEINNDEEYRGAGEVLQQVKRQIKRINGTRDGIVKPVKEGIAYIDNLFKPLVYLLTKQGEEVLKKRFVAYSEEQDRIRREQEAVARKEAAERQAELDRQAMAKAEAAREAGDETRAAEIEQQTPQVVVPVISTPTEKPSGIGMRGVWRWELVDIEKVPREYFILDEKRIGALVRAEKDKTNIPGIRVYEEKSVSVRT